MKLRHSESYTLDVEMKNKRCLDIIDNQIGNKVWFRIFDSIQVYNSFVNDLDNFINVIEYEIVEAL